MKFKTIMVTTFIAMFALTSCNEDNGPLKSETASFFIQIAKSVERSRAEGGDMSAEEVEFTDGYLIFTTGDKIGRVVNIVATPTGTDEVSVSLLEGGTEIREVPANTTNVYLYGNLGSSLSTIGNIAIPDGSLATVQALTWTLANIQNAANNVDDVPVYGEGIVTPKADELGKLESTFPVGPIASRLQIGTISCSDTEVTKLELAGIYINGFYHSMDANSTFKDVYMVDNGIDPSKYPATGYTVYTTMSDILDPVQDIKTTAATPGANTYWAYNFFPAPMPHIVLHFANIEANGGVSETDKYATVAKYSTSPSGGEGNEFTTAEAGYVYTLNIDITDYKTQITDLPESDSEVVGYVKITIVDWQGATIHPEW